MLKRLLDYILGSRDFTVADCCAESAAILLTRSGADLRSLKRHKSGELTFTLPLYDCRAVTEILRESGIEFTAARDRGLLRLLKRYRKRIGLPIGLLLFCFILAVSEKFIWTVEVKGNDTVGEREIIERMEALGCGVGSYIPGIDFDMLHANFLLENREFSWVAVNVVGTHATIELRELIKHPDAPNESVPHNLIAAEDGVVQSIDIYRGIRVAEAGQLVREGELLASGVIDTEDGYKLCHARGVVMAQVERELKLEIPLVSEGKRVLKDTPGALSLSILGFSVNLFEKTGNLPPMCDKIYTERKVTLFGQIVLPITVCETVIREYTTETVTITPETARARAFDEMRRSVNALEGELLSRRVNGFLDGEVYRLDCELTLLVDIAREQEIYVAIRGDK